ncbi:TonB-dependent receptor [Granulicella tundricola]|uniref:Cna B domain protein n=1 Tax=Granulicella tundricola (strain ATCC BAA-1859 / DSM 23138 / MP5ACTX9) TaxID=1198114 RepID=E8X5T5_GRATM|nr:carboxypeptidase regulatory-like domain-containing protein [Granulicella tundricola]ADW70819.1 Cna B domain protein [Granulicella tundricola MP5ACTX9]
MRNPFVKTASLYLLSASLLATPSLLAQSNTGTILGTVQDDSGAVVPDATVTIKSLGTGETRTVKSSANGEYTFPNLQIGHYSVTVTHEGFASVQIADTELQVAQKATINPVIHVGAVTDKVTVIAAEVPLLNAATSSVGQVIDTQTVQNVPLNGRNFWQLTQLTPGVSFIQGGQNIASGGTSIRASAVNVNVNGLSPSWTGWYLDGANITEFQLGGTIIQPNVDALQEFKVESGNMGADYGHSPTVINATLKSGTNKFHGVLYEFLRNNALDAKNYFFVPPTGSTQRDEPLHRNQFGFAVGGPIYRDKTFFFVDLQETLFSQAQNFNSVVPTAAQRNGDFSALPVILIDPTTKLQFQDGGVLNKIPQNRISPQAQYLLKYMPLPNFVSNGTSRAIVTNKLKQQLGQGDIRIDHQLFAADHLTGRYSISDNRETDPNAYTALGGFPLRSRGQNAVVRETHVFSPKLINDLQVSYYRSYFLFTSSLQGTNIDDLAGITGLDGLAPPSTVGFPSVTISNYSNYNGQANNSYPKQNKIRSWQYVDHLNYASGKQDIRIGYELFHNTNTFIAGNNSTGTFNFNGLYTGKNCTATAGVTCGDNFADFLIGDPLSGSRSTFRNIWGSNGNFQSMFFQDDIKVLPNLTVNAGIREEINPFWTALKGQTSGFDTATGKLVIPTNIDPSVQPLTPSLLTLFADRFETTASLHLPENVRSTAYANVAPRLGFAYSPKPSTVLRGAYGIFFLFPDDNAINNTQNTVPFIASQTVNNATPTPTLTFGNFFSGQPVVTANTTNAVCSFGFVANSCSTPSITSMALHVQNTYIQEYNAAVQHQFGARISLDVAYVGNKTTHMQQAFQINDPNPAAGAVQNRRQLPQWGTISDSRFAGNGSYNALQTKFEARGFAGATFLASYTYSKCLTDGTYTSVVREDTPLIRYYGVCNYDLTHNFVTSYVYELPFGRGKTFLSHTNSIINQAIANWQVSGIVTLQSGLPYTPTISADQANTGVGSQRPNVIGRVTNTRNVNCWFFDSRNTACKSLAPNATDAYALPTQYTYGNGGINLLRSDGLVQFDMSLLKDFHFSESRSLELRGSFFNLFNHATFATPVTNIDSTTAGQVSSTLNGSRQIELAAKIYF